MMEIGKVNMLVENKEDSGKNDFLRKKEFLRKYPDQIPKVGDVLYHFSLGKLESFDRNTGAMYFAKEEEFENLFIRLIKSDVRILYKIRVKKDFSIDLFKNYHSNSGWGVKLNDDNAVKWLSLSNYLLEEYLEIAGEVSQEDYDEDRIYSFLLGEPNLEKFPIKQIANKRNGVRWLTRFMDKSLTLKDLEKDKGSIMPVLQQLANGAVFPSFNINDVKLRFRDFEDFGWKFPLKKEI